MKSFLVFSCPHVPLHSKDAHAWLLKQIKDRKPDVVVCAGDLFEADAASVWHNEQDFDLLDEFEAGAKYLKSVREVSRDAELHWLLGNHDANVQRKDHRRIPKEVRRVCDWNRHNDEFKRWKQYPYVKSRKGLLQLGQQVIVTHGYDAGVSSDEHEALQFSNYAGQAYCLVIRGHTHRPQPVTQCLRTKRIPLPFWFANAGTMCDIPRMEYASRLDTSQWGSAVVVGEFMPLKSPRLSVTWEAHTIVHKMGYQL